MKIGFIGAGAMGRPMVDKLIAAGHDVTVLMRRPKAQVVAEADGLACAATIADTVRDAQVVFCVVLTDEQVRSVCIDPEGALVSMSEGAVMVQHTTCDPATVGVVAEAAAAQGVEVLDAALSGGPSDIAAGKLTLWVGGDEAQLERLRPLLGAYAAPIMHVGALGNGQRIKLVNNALFVAQVGVAVDAVRLGALFGIDERAVLPAVQHGSGRSSALEIVASASTVEVLAEWVGALMLKDLSTVRMVAERANVDLGIIGTVLSSDAVRRALGADQLLAR